MVTLVNSRLIVIGQCYLSMLRYSEFRTINIQTFPKAMKANLVANHSPISSMVLHPGGGGGGLVPTMPVCVCRKVKDMGPSPALSE